MRADDRPTNIEFAESGYSSTNYARWKRKSDVLRTARVLLCVMLAILILGGGSNFIFAHWLKTVDSIFSSMEKKQRVDGAVCSSSYDVGERSVQWVVLADQKLRLMTPVIVNRNATTISTIEEVDPATCPNAGPIRATRHVRIRVQYKQPGRFFGLYSTSTVDLEGDSAVCIQHQLDVFNARIDCEAGRIRATRRPLEL